MSANWAEELVDAIQGKRPPAGAKSGRELHAMHVARGGTLGWSRFRHLLRERTDLDRCTFGTPRGAEAFYWPKAPAGGNKSKPKR